MNTVITFPQVVTVEKEVPIWRAMGHRLKMYYDEKEEYARFWSVRYATPKEATKYLKKLKRHFKLYSMVWQFDKINSGSAQANSWGCKIRLPYKDISLGMICHEVAHVVHYLKCDKMGHNKQFYKQLRRVYRWAERYL